MFLVNSSVADPGFLKGGSFSFSSDFKPPKFQIPAMFNPYLQSTSAQFSHTLNKRSALVTVLQSSKIWSLEITEGFPELQ